MGKGGGGDTQTIQKADPWEGVQPALRSLYNQAHNLLKSGKNYYNPQYYPGSTVAGQSANTLQGIQSLANRAQAGSPLNSANKTQALKTLQGDYLGANNPYNAGLLSLANRNVNQTPGFDTLSNIAEGGMLNSNPYLDQMFDSASRAVNKNFSANALPGIASMFSAGGRYGSSQMGDRVGQAASQYGATLNDLAGDIYGQNYANERQLQQAALGQLGSLDVANNASRLGAYNSLEDAFGRERAMQMSMGSLAPSIANQDYTDIGQLISAGGMQDSYKQSLINADVNKWNYNQRLPVTRLQDIGSILSGGLGAGGTTNSSTDVSGNPLAGALGGALLGGSALPFLGSTGLLGSTAAASGLMGGAGINALGGLGLGPLGALGGAILGGLFS